MWDSIAKEQRLIETRVVFELIVGIHVQLLWIRLIETRVVFESKAEKCVFEWTARLIETRVVFELVIRRKTIHNNL